MDGMEELDGFINRAKEGADVAAESHGCLADANRRVWENFHVRPRRCRKAHEPVPLCCC